MFHLDVLGAPVLRGPSGPVTGRAAYKRRIALLAILAIARRRPVGRERLIGLLWPETASDTARHTLSESLYVLRKELGEGAFLAVGDDLALSPDAVCTDVSAFEEALEERRLEDAVAAYGGPFMDGFYVSDAPEFEHWVDAERDRLARAYAQALEALAGRAEAEGRLLEAAEWLRRLAAHDPHSSRVALRLAGVLDAAGERAAALRALAGHTARVRADMEMEPDAAVRALEQRLRTAPPPPPPAPPSPPGPSDSPATSSPTAPPAPADVDADAGTLVAEDEAAATLLRRTEAREPVAAAPVRRPRGPSARWGPALAVAALLLVLAAAALMPSLARGPAADAAPPAERYDPRRIAVLYFDDQSPRGDLGYLAAGLTGALIDQLGGVTALQVVSRNGVKAYRDGEMSFDSLVARLRVGSVVEGSVQRAGDSVRVTVQLVDTNADKQLESRTVIRHAGDLFALEESVGEEVSGFLRRRLGREVRLRQAAEETRSAQALDLFFRAEAARDEAARMARRGDPLDEGSALRLLARADTFLAAAEAADPTWARPSVTRGLAALTRATLVSGPARGALHRAAAASASRALALAPGDAAALALRGRVKWRQALDAGATPDTGRVAAAERDLRAAVEADSSMASAWAALSQLLRVRGQLAESDLAARRALAADAWLEADGLILTRLYFTALGQGDFPQAREWCRQGRAHFPADWRFVECSLTLARNDPAERPDPARAWALLAELDRLDPPARAAGEGRAYARVYRQAAVAAILARAGKADSARAVLARAREEAAAQSDGSRVAFLYDEAFATLLLGDRAGARRLLDAYVGAQPALRPYVAREPAFRGLFAP